MKEQLTGNKKFFNTKNDILPSATTWIDPAGILLSEINQKEKDKYCMISLIREV